MKKALIACMLCIIFFSLKAQNFKVSFSNLESYNRFAYITEAGEVGNNLFVFVSNQRMGRTILLNIYDKVTLELKSSKAVLDINCKNKDCINSDFEFKKTLFLHNNVVMLFQKYDRSGKNLQLYAQQLDKNGSFTGKFQQIDEIDSKSRRNTGSFMIWQSEDSSKFVIIDNPPFEKYAGEKFGFKIYDNTLNNLKNFSIALPYKDKNLEVTDFYIGNDSRIHLLTQIELEKKQQKAGSASKIYSVFTINPEDKSVAEYKLDLPKRSIEDVALILDNKHKKFICCGFYSDLKPRAKVGKDLDGFFYLRTDIETRQQEALSTKELDKSLVAELLNKKKAKENQGITKTFEIRDFINHTDGTTTLITENRRLQIVTHTSCTQNGGCISTTNYYYYRDNIFLINITPEGTVASFTDIPKQQYSADDQGKYLSFLPFQKDDRLICIFNDNPENLNASIKSIKDVKMMYSIKKAIVVAVEVNKNGSFNKFKLFDNTERKISIIPERAIKIGNGKYILPAEVPPSFWSCSCFAMFSKAKLGIAKIEL